MPFKIQRAPQGLNNLLSIFGGATPTELEDRVRPSIETLQFYGLQQQRVIFGNDGALAEGGTVDADVSSPGNTSLRSQWCVLYGASFGGIKTATMTAFRGNLGMIRNGSSNSITLAEGEFGPFGATETGPVGIPFVAPYPIILRPPWRIFGRLAILGTDASANCTCIAEIGVLQ